MVKDKQRAYNYYDDSISSGHAAFLAEEEEETPDILKMTIGGVQAGQEVAITVVMLQVLEVDCGAYELRIPESWFLKFDKNE